MKLTTILSVLFAMSLSSIASADSFHGTFDLTDDFTSPVSVTGDIYPGTSTLSVDPFVYNGKTFTLMVGEVLASGTYYRTYTDSNGFQFKKVATIPAGHTGAYVAFETIGGGVAGFLVWQVSPDGKIYTNVENPGNKILGGPYSLNFLSLSFAIDRLGEFISLDPAVAGGLTQECSEYGGSTITVESNHVPQNGAVLDSISWVVDGGSAGNGVNLTRFFPLGDSVVEATAVATSGEVTQASITITVRDSKSPVTSIKFYDSIGNEITTASPGDVEVSIIGTDVCDPDPVEGRGRTVPTYLIDDGDVLTVTSGTANLGLPVTAISVSASSTDASGNQGFTATSVLSIQ